jgi:hypothetical protein
MTDVLSIVISDLEYFCSGSGSDFSIVAQTKRFILDYFWYYTQL